MARLRSGVRYRLRRAPEGEAATPSNDALAWLVSLNAAFTYGPTMRPNLEAIARAAGINSAALFKTVQGGSELSQRMMAALVCASGARHDVAFAALFELVRDEQMVEAAA